MTARTAEAVDKRIGAISGDDKVRAPDGRHMLLARRICIRLIIGRRAKHIFTKKCSAEKSGRPKSRCAAGNRREVGISFPMRKSAVSTRKAYGRQLGAINSPCPQARHFGQPPGFQNPRHFQWQAVDRRIHDLSLFSENKGLSPCSTGSNTRWTTTASSV